MPVRSFATLGVTALILIAAPRVAFGFADTEPCLPARASFDNASSGPWRSALDALIASTAERGQPWSCSGGSVELELVENGAVLRVARAGEPPVIRKVSSPQDVLPLGQALLATALVRVTPPDEHATEPAVVVAASSPPAEVRPNHSSAPTAAPLARIAAPTPSPSIGAPRRLLLAVGLDARAVGRSNVMWLGPVASAGVALGKWLPTISFRIQSDLIARRPTVDELSVASTLQRRFALSQLELRLGPLLRAAGVERHLPERRGQQIRLEGRAGALAACMIPVLDWAKLVVSVDAELVLGARDPVGPSQQSGDEPATAFPVFTLGGNASLEFAL